MKSIIKQFIIVVLSFTLILWVQHIDDKKNGVVRQSWWDKLNFPLLVSCLIGLVLNLPFLFHCADNSVDTTNSSDVKELVGITANKPFLQELLTPSPSKPELPINIVNNAKPTEMMGGNMPNEFISLPINPLIAPLSDQTIFTDLPDF